MRSVKKLLKKAMVFTLSAAMLVGTPLTASAAPLNSVYSIGDHWGEITKPGEGNDHSHTGTITNTATSTDSGVLKENETKILGIALDKKHLDVEVGGTQEILTATFLLDATEDELEKKYGHGTRTLKEELARRIRWEVQNPDGSVDAETNKTLSIRVTDADKVDNKTGDASQVILNPRRGTKAGQDMIVKAYLEGSWYIGVKCDDEGNPILENGKEVPQIKELTDKKTDGYSAEATVSIKEYTKTLSWKDGQPVTNTYVKHTINLGAELVRDPATANDTITWTSTNPQVATVNAQGVVTVKNKLTSNDVKCKIIAMGERKSAYVERTINVEAGTPVTKIEIYKESEINDANAKALKKLDGDSWDLGKLENKGYQATEKLQVKLYATVKNVVVKDDGKTPAMSLDEAKKSKGKVVVKTLTLPDGTDYYLANKDKTNLAAKKDTVKITDVITWSSNKTAIANVSPTTGEKTTVKSQGTIGTASIMAKASSGKNAKVNVVVKGTLAKLAISGIGDGDTLYSGQTRDLVAEKKPVGSKDGVAWSIEKVTKNGRQVNHPNVTINGKGKLTIKDKLDPNYMTAKINLASAKKVNGTPVVGPVSVTINLAQSSINGITVTDVTNNNTPVAKTIYRDQTSNVKETGEIKNRTAYIKVPLNHSFQAVVNAGYNSTTQGLDPETLAGTLTWTTSNNKVVDITGNGSSRKITAKAAGNATITVTGLRATSKVQNGNTVLKGVSKLKVTFKVAVTQPVETMTMNKPAITVAYQPKSKTDSTPKPQNVALKVTLGPKGVKTNTEKLTWSVVKTKGTADNTAVPQIGSGANKKNTDKLNATFKLVAPKPGDEYVVTAKSSTGVVATSTIKVVQKTVGVEMSPNASLGSDNKPAIFKEGKANNKKNIKIGESFPIYSFVNVGESARKPTWEKAGKDDTIEGVTYSVNKKGIVSIDSKGNVVGLGKGTVKITAKTPMGKSKAITVVVDVPTTQN